MKKNFLTLLFLIISVSSFAQVVVSGKAVFTQLLRDVPPKILVAFVIGSASSVIKLQLSGEFKMTSSDLELAFFICWDGIKKA